MLPADKNSGDTLLDALRDAEASTSLRDKVVQRVRSDIVSGRSAPGTMYSVPTLADQLGVSTTPVREALLELSRGGLITPLRSAGGHRRYSRYQLRIAARARELVDHGTPVEAACRIVILEDQLEEALRMNAEYRRAAESADPTTAP